MAVRDVMWNAQKKRERINCENTRIKSATAYKGIKLLLSLLLLLFSGKMMLLMVWALRASHPKQLTVHRMLSRVSMLDESKTEHAEYISHFLRSGYGLNKFLFPRRHLYRPSEPLWNGWGSEQLSRQQTCRNILARHQWRLVSEADRATNTISAVNEFKHTHIRNRLLIYECLRGRFRWAICLYSYTHPITPITFIYNIWMVFIAFGSLHFWLETFVHMRMISYHAFAIRNSQFENENSAQWSRPLTRTHTHTKKSITIW